MSPMWTARVAQPRQAGNEGLDRAGVARKGANPRINRAWRRLTKTVPFGEAVSRRSRKKEPLAGAMWEEEMQYLIPGLMIAIVVGGALVAMRMK
jgi:hypothetical protein